MGGGGRAGGGSDAADEILTRARTRIAEHGLSMARPSPSSCANGRALRSATVAVLGEDDEREAVELLANAFSADGCPADAGEPEPAFDWALGPQLRHPSRAPASPLSAQCGSDGAERCTKRATWYNWYLRWVVLVGLRYGLVLGLYLPNGRPALSSPPAAPARGELAAVAVALPPGRHWAADTVSWASRRRPHMYAIGLKVGRPPPDEWRPGDFPPGTSARMRAIGSAAVRAREDAMSERGWHLYAMGTKQAHQRSGCAAMLLRALGEIADADGAEIFAEAASPRLRALLSRFGFQPARDATPAVRADDALPECERPPRIVLMRRSAVRVKALLRRKSA